MSFTFVKKRIPKIQILSSFLNSFLKFQIKNIRFLTIKIPFYENLNNDKELMEIISIDEINSCFNYLKFHFNCLFRNYCYYYIHYFKFTRYFTSFVNYILNVSLPTICSLAYYFWL